MYRNIEKEEQTVNNSVFLHVRNFQRAESTLFVALFIGHLLAALKAVTLLIRQ